MILRYSSVPILDEMKLELPGRTPGERKVQTTTIYNMRDRRQHVLEIKLCRPAVILKILAFSLLYFAGIYMFTLFVPGGILAITKDKTLGWVFGAWAIPVFIGAIGLSRNNVLNRQMLKHALKERELPASAKIHIVPERQWDRWVAKLR
jgi:hypothetical protein